MKKFSNLVSVLKMIQILIFLCLLINTNTSETASSNLRSIDNFSTKSTCDPSSSRTDCGYAGINQQQCESKGCCWSPTKSTSNDTPWCFNPSTKPTCDPSSFRTDCGFVGVNQQQCETKGCCWSPAKSSSNDIPWCFNPSSKPDPYVPPPGNIPFNSTELAKLEDNFLRNIDVSKMQSDPCNAEFADNGFGGVVAAPDCNTGSGGSYVYAWLRDSALTMKTLMDTNGNKQLVNEKLEKYSKWVVANHNSNSPNGIDIRIEPKMMLPRPGQVYTGAWCRPQNDGPGLQAITLMSFANQLMKKNSDKAKNNNKNFEEERNLEVILEKMEIPPSEIIEILEKSSEVEKIKSSDTKKQNKQDDFIRQYLWTGNPQLNHGGAIKYDLDWIIDNYNSDSCDLWEEIRSTDFFWNHYTMRKALSLGAEFARKMGDETSASKYSTVASAITAEIKKNHWNGQFIFESTNRPKDTAVIIALNEGYLNDSLFNYSSQEVASTILTFNNLFGNSYNVNQRDQSIGVPGILYGRYEGDRYEEGGPWILNSAALAQLYYNAGIEVITSTKKEGKFEIKIEIGLWEKVLNNNKFKGLKYNAKEFAKALFNNADGVLLRIRYHVEKYDFHLSEQIDRQSGLQRSAKDLTWSYAEVLKAMKKRSELEKLLQDEN